MPKTVLRDVRVFDGNELTRPRTVVIDGTVIGEDPAGGHEIDAAGATLLPGLIDAHVHLHGPEDLRTLARWGVTTGLDMACWPVERVASLRAVTGAADFRTAGLPAIGRGSHAKMPAMPEDAVILTADDARRHVEARAAEGVDYIKGVTEAPGEGGLPADALRALVAAAREHGLKTVVHAVSPGAYSIAVDSGAEFVTHVPLTGPIRTEDIAAMKAAGQVAIPTITMMEGILTTGPQAGRFPVDGLLRSLADLHAAGVGILAGTDANDEPGAPIAVRHGESLHHEFELMAQAGMTSAEILRSATADAARAFGLTDRGTIAPGLRADLVLIAGDPLQDIAATRDIRAVWCAGTEITPTTGHPS
ncbi:amidohydrolase family protein [Kibdelosporangium persicum]|uniref:Imidazolonepropionase n=1 Tax=Kibdelosporangium persicum TaxID=2698649 RepID=A0ABX2F9P3_9PSEU|nr:amidohydrolase family protein [Kibdelosporangium persicum]NRN68037.1 Imidazolonepropionase [Kibdelosporangium persicum]